MLYCHSATVTRLQCDVYDTKLGNQPSLSLSIDNLSEENNTVIIIIITIIFQYTVLKYLVLTECHRAKITSRDDNVCPVCAIVKENCIDNGIPSPINASRIVTFPHSAAQRLLKRCHCCLIGFSSSL